MSSISNLPTELLLKVCLHLPYESVLSSLLVNRRFYAVLKANWKKMNTQFKVEKMILAARPDQNTEMSLYTANSGNVKFIIGDNWVNCQYEDSPQDKALPSAIIQFNIKKSRYSGQTSRPFNRSMFKPMSELHHLLMYLLPMSDIRKLVVMNLGRLTQTHLECFIDCFRATDSVRSRGVPVVHHSSFPRYLDLCRALRCPELSFTNPGRISNFDTSLKIPVRVPTSWYSGNRTIFNYSAGLSPGFCCYTKPMTTSSKRPGGKKVVFVFRT